MANVFPAAAEPEPARDDGPHPAWCICVPCMTRAVTALATPLVPGSVGRPPERTERRR